MIKAAITIGSAAILAGLASMMPAPSVQAGTSAARVEAAASIQHPAGVAETPAIAAGCSQRAWPYYAQGCPTDFDARWRGEPRKVRLVTTDRLN
jgi:hypothetical protein